MARFAAATSMGVASAGAGVVEDRATARGIAGVDPSPVSMAPSPSARGGTKPRSGSRSGFQMAGPGESTPLTEPGRVAVRTEPAPCISGSA